jgi:uncharacterized protein YjbI with pentapeptide repeats
MTPRSWSIAVALLITLLVVVAYGSWLEWDWKAMIGWRRLVDYIDPDDATDRKDAVQVYAVITAGIIASITAAVGLANLRLTRKNLEQQRDLEAQRAKEQRNLEAQRAEQQRQLAQGTALQAYYEQIGTLLTESNLRDTQRKEIRELARGQTLTVLREVDRKGKGSLLIFLHGAGLIEAGNPAVSLSGADLRGADLRGADLRGADLQGAILIGANLYAANLLGAVVTDEQFAFTRALEGATMPDGQTLRGPTSPKGPTFEDWLKSQGRKEDGNNE